MSWNSALWLGESWFSPNWFATIDPASTSNTYPSPSALPRLAVIRPLDTEREELTGDNTPISADTSLDVVYRLTVTHPDMSTVELATLKDYFDNFRKAPFVIDEVGDGYTYAGLLPKDPAYTFEDGIRRSAEWSTRVKRIA